MARNVKKNELYYLFDHQEDEQALLAQERPNLAQRLKSFLSSRYALLATIVLLSGCLIFYSTARLQLGDTVAAGVSETTGVPRQHTIKAPRGDILAADGLPLAYSTPLNVLHLSYAGLESDQLNQMLLDLASLLDEHEVDWPHELEDYLQRGPAGLYFNKTPEEILYWQTKSGVFPLKEGAEGKAAVDNQYAKPNARMLYDYLLYYLFAIENPAADGHRYSPDEAWQIMNLRYLIRKNNWAFINGSPLELARKVDDELVQIINEQNYRYQGVLSTVEYERHYTEEAVLLSHVLGYVGSISPEQYYDWSSAGYAPDAVVGQAGVELTAERYLSGKDGIRPYNIWSVAAESGAFYPEDSGRAAEPGFDVRLTIDLRLQEIAHTSLIDAIEKIRSSPDNKNKGDADAGAVVMLDVKTGAVLAMVSEPGYNPADFVDQFYDETAADNVQAYLTDNVNKPIWNRAISEIYAPGSTFKPMTAVAGLQSGAITPYRNIIRCVGHEIIGDWPWSCLQYPRGGHGDLTLTSGMASSCNLYFFNLGVRTGIDNIDYWGGQFGLGEYTGIDLPGESKGFRSSRETKKLLRSNPQDQVWFPADTCQTAIGQFDNSFSVIQLAVYTAGLATGNKVTPYVIDQVTRQDGVLIKRGWTEPVPLAVDPANMAAVRQGMTAVVSSREGTANKFFADFPVSVAAKTGTAETGFEDRSSSNGLFICFAPAEDPQVAIAQIIEKGAWGKNTIEVARNLLAAYFQLDDEEAGQAGPGLVDVPDLPQETELINPDEEN